MLHRNRLVRLSDNRISLTNKHSHTLDYLKWNKSKRPPGIPQKNRLDTKPVAVLHETPKIIVAGRNRCNNFNSNQYAIISRKTNEAVLIDAADDWPDDWVAFLNEGGFRVSFIFFTHLHIDNIIGLAPLCKMLGPEVKFAWNKNDDYWLHKFSACCARYQRHDMMYTQLPLLRPQKQHGDIMLTSAASRSTSFIPLGDTMLNYIHTPGHSMGHTVLHVPQEKLLFSGDLLFFDKVGRVDLPFATGELLAQSLRALEDLPDNTVVLPGHGRMTTMGREREHNLGLQRVYEWLAAGKRAPRVGFNEEGYL